MHIFYFFDIGIAKLREYLMIWKTLFTMILMSLAGTVSAAWVKLSQNEIGDNLLLRHRNHQQNGDAYDMDFDKLRQTR
jgi:hypothetical protein